MRSVEKRGERPGESSEESCRERRVQEPGMTSYRIFRAGFIRAVMNNLVCWMENEESRKFREMYRNCYMSMDSLRKK